MDVALIVFSDELVSAIAHLVWFALGFALLHHERWRRPAAREVWDRYAVSCQGAGGR